MEGKLARRGACGQPEEAAWARAELAKLDAKIQAVCWDGKWFIWAIGQDGTVYGPKNFAEGQVYMNTQVWAVLSGAATPAQATQALKTMKEKRVPWLSGTATWAYYSATHWVLGVRPEVEGLRIAPCIPKTWPGFKMTRTFRGKRVKIEVQNPAGVNRGLKSLAIDGVAVEGEVVPRADQAQLEDRRRAGRRAEVES